MWQPFPTNPAGQGLWRAAQPMGYMEDTTRPVEVHEGHLQVDMAPPSRKTQREVTRYAVPDTLSMNTAAGMSPTRSTHLLKASRPHQARLPQYSGA